MKNTSNVSSELKIQRASIYGFTREKRKKRISNEWILNDTKLSSKTYSVLLTFLYKNLVILVNLFEIPRMERKKIHPPIHLEGGDPKKELAKAYITSFTDKKNGVLLNDLQLCDDDDSFSIYAHKISQLFLETRFWPRTYLFITQFSIKHPRIIERFIGILTTKLQYGQLAEDPERIISQIESGIIGDTVKKAAIYPHISEENGKIITKPYVKVYEDTPRPAKYFYRFLSLDYPTGSREFVENQYSEICQKGLSIDAFVGSLKKDAPELLNQVHTKTVMDDIETNSSLADLYNKIQFARISDKEYLLLVKGSKISVLLGKDDLVKDGVIKFIDKKTLLNKALKGKEV